MYCILAIGKAYFNEFNTPKDRRCEPSRPWPADQVEHWPVERLIPYTDTPRVHSVADLDKLADAVHQWGWTVPAVVDEPGRMRARGTARKSRSIACAGRSSTTAGPARSSTTRLSASARPSSPAEVTSRVCRAIELNPVYVDVILKRWQLFTGRAAIHQASGRSFDERASRPDRDRSGSADG
jgi:hypothetical protein